MSSQHRKAKEAVMDRSPFRFRGCLHVAGVALSGFLIAGCGGGGESAGAQATEQTPASASRAAGAASRAVQAVKACAVFTKAEIEAATGRAVLDPVEEALGELSTCSFGDPDSPKVAGRSLTRVVILSVFSGGDFYFEGPVAQARGIYEMAERNAGEVRAVPDLGDRARWAGLTLRALRGPYMVEVQVDAGDDSRRIAEQLARTAVSRLP